MNRVAARLVVQLIALQLLWVGVTMLVAAAFAPRLLLLERAVVTRTLPSAAMFFAALVASQVVVTLVLSRPLRSTLLSLTTGSRGVPAVDLLRLNALPARLTGANVFAALIASFGSLARPFRPPNNDLHTQLSMVLLTMNMVSAGALPLYVMLRTSIARVLELAPAPASREALGLFENDSRRAPRVKLRLLLAVVAPVAFVAFGASLLVYAHVRAFDVAARESDASELARATFDLVGGGAMGRDEAIGEAKALGYQANVYAEAAPFSVVHREDGIAVVTVPLDFGHAVVRFATTPWGPGTTAYLLLALVATALAAFVGSKIGTIFTADVVLATRSIRAIGIADVMKGTRMQGEARFVSVSQLMEAINELAGVFREFASAQERAIEAREATERMRGLFLASMSHDLKGPLNAILGFAELVSRSTLTEAQQESLAIIVQRGRELLSLVQTILDAARIEAGELQLSPSLTMVGDVVMSAVLEARELTFGSTVEIVAEIQPGVPKVYVDDSRITQSLTSVILGAVRFTVQGVVHVRATFSAPSDVLRIDVETSGRNVPDEEQEKLFDAFRQPARARRTGSVGLSLNLARAIVELHGGAVEVDRREGAQMAFHVWLPTTPERWSARPARPSRGALDG